MRRTIRRRDYLQTDKLWLKRESGYDRAIPTLPPADHHSVVCGSEPATLEDLQVRRAAADLIDRIAHPNI
jgi:hypothetical protein